MVWGVKDDELVLVRKDSQFKLIFDAISPSASAGQVPANDEAQMLLQEAQLSSKDAVWTILKPCLKKKKKYV